MLPCLSLLFGLAPATRTGCHSVAIDVFAMPDTIQHHVAPNDIVADPIGGEPQAPLADAPLPFAAFRAGAGYAHGLSLSRDRCLCDAGHDTAPRRAERH